MEDWTREELESFAELVGIDDIDYFIAHSFGELPDNCRVVSREWSAYGDWVTYADGHEEFESIGD